MKLTHFPLDGCGGVSAAEVILQKSFAEKRRNGVFLDGIVKNVAECGMVQ